MAVRFYLVPIAGSGTMADPYRPKYVEDSGARYSAMDYGREPVMLVGAEVTADQHRSVAAHADVVAIPEALETPLGADLTTVQQALEAMNIPAIGTLTAATTYRQMIGHVGRLCHLAQRFNGLFKDSPLSAAVTLDAAADQVSAIHLARLHRMAETFGLTAKATTGATMREALTRWASALPPFMLMGQRF